MLSVSYRETDIRCNSVEYDVEYFISIFYLFYQTHIPAQRASSAIILLTSSCARHTFRVELTMKIIKDFAMLIMVATMSLALAACGDDTKNEPDDPSDSGNGNGGDKPGMTTESIVGTWEYTLEYDNFKTFETYTFNADGTFSYYMYEINDGVKNEDKSNGIYSFKHGVLTLNWVDHDTEEYPCSLDGRKLTIGSQEFTRTDESEIPDDPVVANPLIGSWEYSETGYYEVITFNADGTFMMYFRDPSFNDTGYGTYSYTSNRIILMMYGEDEIEEAAYSINGKTLTIWDPSDPSDIQKYTYTTNPDIRS